MKRAFGPRRSLKMHPVEVPGLLQLVDRRILRLIAETPVSTLQQTAAGRQ